MWRNTRGRARAAHAVPIIYFKVLTTLYYKCKSFLDLSFLINGQLNHDRRKVYIGLKHISRLLLRVGLAAWRVSTTIAPSLTSELSTTTPVDTALAPCTSGSSAAAAGATAPFEARIVTVVSLVVAPRPLLISILVIAIVAVVRA